MTLRRPEAGKPSVGGARPPRLGLHSIAHRARPDSRVSHRSERSWCIGMCIAMCIGMCIATERLRPGRSSGCVPKTCADLSINCGPAADGCGNQLDCGTCTAPQTCGGSGTPSVCGTGTSCVPKTCADLGATCGPAGVGALAHFRTIRTSTTLVATMTDDEIALYADAAAKVIRARGGAATRDRDRDAPHARSSASSRTTSRSAFGPSIGRASSPTTRARGSRRSASSPGSSSG
jgi:hypothetical protein